MNDATLYVDYIIRQNSNDQYYYQYLPISENFSTQVIEHSDEIKVYNEEKAGDSILKVAKNESKEKWVKKIENDGHHDKHNDIGKNYVSERLEPVAPGKLPPTASNLDHEPSPENNETGQENIENFYPIIDKYIHHIHHLKVGLSGFEPPTFRLSAGRSNHAKLQPQYFFLENDNY